MAGKKKAKKSSGGKKQRSPKQKAAQKKASRAAHAKAGGTKKKRRSSGGGKKKHKKRRSGGGGSSLVRSTNPGKSGAMSLKQFGVAALKIGGMATLGFIAGEMLRRWLLAPKKDGSQSMLAGFEAKHGTSPALSAVITGLPGVAGGVGLYYAGKKFSMPMLRTAGGALAIGGVVSGGSRLLLGNTFVATKTGGLQLVQGASAGAPGNALLAPGTASAGYGQYQQQPAWKQLGDAFVQNPYGDQWTGNPYEQRGMGDAFVSNPGGSYVDRVGDRPRAASGFGITAAEELGE